MLVTEKKAGSVQKLDLFPEVDTKKTGRNVKSFFRDNYPKLERFAGYGDMIKSPIIDGQPHSKSHSFPDKQFITHASYSELFDAVKEAIGNCKDPAKTIIIQHYVNGRPLYIVANMLSISVKTLYNKQGGYLVEFAVRLLTSTSHLGKENIIDLHSYL